jgi:protein-S-isoprenylcysteine O-methyltransferase Ste14
VSDRWRRVAKRIRVPLGFAFAVLYLWLARPTPLSMLLSLLLVVPGLMLRGYASGYVRKNAELTVTGPYAHTRNPLYLGSMMIAFGFAAASLSAWIAAALVLLFAAIYIPVIRGEEEYLEAHFAGFAAYRRAVPRLLPRVYPASAPGSPAPAPGSNTGHFDLELYRKHREYNSLMGAAAIYGVLALRLFWWR